MDEKNDFFLRGAMCARSRTHSNSTLIVSLPVGKLTVGALGKNDPPNKKFVRNNNCGRKIVFFFWRGAMCARSRTQSNSTLIVSLPVGKLTVGAFGKNDPRNKFFVRNNVCVLSC